MKALVFPCFAFLALACGTTPAGSSGGSDAGSGSGGNESSCPEDTGARPSPRGDFAAVVDGEVNELVLFGGDPGVAQQCQPNPQFDGETWIFNLACHSWRKVETQGPSARARMATAFDSAHHRLLFFGGRTRPAGTTTYTVFHEVWAFDLAAEAWTQLQITGDSPAGVANASAIYRPKTNALVVFGGNSSTSGLSFAPSSQIWSLSLDTLTWTRLAAHAGTVPPAREYQSAAYDAENDRMLVFSGGDANAFFGPFLDDLWSFDFSSESWTQLTPDGDTPPNRIRGQLAADPARHRFLLFGGHDDGEMGERNDLVSLDIAANRWTTVHAGDQLHGHSSGFCHFPADFVTPDLKSPERREAHFLGLDTKRGVLVMVGGEADCGDLNDVWELDPTSGTWTNVSPAFTGVSCERSGKQGCSSLCF